MVLGFTQSYMLAISGCHVFLCVVSVFLQKMPMAAAEDSFLFEEKSQGIATVTLI